MRFKQVTEYDNHNHGLSKEQSDYFKDSKIRDTKGRLLVCYHGTHFFGFNEFDPLGMDKGFSYFTVDYSYADVYASDDFDDENASGIYHCYLLCKNPLNVNNIEKEMFTDGSYVYKIRDLGSNEKAKEFYSEELKELAKKDKCFCMGTYQCS